MTTTTTWIVPGVTCGHCKASIEAEVGQVAGVERAEVDVDAKRLTVTGEASKDAIVDAVVEAGFDEVLAE